MDKFWTSILHPDLKKRFFVVTVESILIYRCESWALNDGTERILNGTYTHMLRPSMNIHWSSHTSNEQLYGKLPVLADKIAVKMLQLAEHCFRYPEVSTQKVALRDPTHGLRSRGQPCTTILDMLKGDTGDTCTCELATLMANKEVFCSCQRCEK